MLKLKEATTNNLFLPDTAYAMKQRNENYNSPESTSVKTKFLDPFCHYNTSLKSKLFYTLLLKSICPLKVFFEVNLQYQILIRFLLLRLCFRSITNKR